MILRWEEEFEWNRYLCTNKHTTMNTFEQRLTALKFVKDNNIQITGKTLLETAEIVFNWANMMPTPEVPLDKIFKAIQTNKIIKSAIAQTPPFEPDQFATMEHDEIV